jgi:hypothetical protein
MQDPAETPQPEAISESCLRSGCVDIDHIQQIKATSDTQNPDAVTEHAISAKIRIETPTTSVIALQNQPAALAQKQTRFVVFRP